MSTWLSPRRCDTSRTLAAYAPPPGHGWIPGRDGIAEAIRQLAAV